MTAESGPAISVVVPTSGRPSYLERCLAALAAAECPPERYEVIVVDDSGGDEIGGVASRFGGPVEPRVVIPERTGPSAARNAGAFAARGEFVAFTDDDCEPAPGWLPAIEGALASNPGAAVGGRTRNGVPDDSAAAASQLVVEALQSACNCDPDAPRFFASYNVAFPANGFRAIGGFDERFRYAEDRELCERWILTGHRFVYTPDALVLHMRRLDLREFWRQHYGYGRGARAFARARRTSSGGTRHGESLAVLRALGARGRAAERHRARLVGYLALSQAATAAGFAREAIVARLTGDPAAPWSPDA